MKSGGGLTEVLVRGAGHLVPVDKSAEARQLVLYFTNDSLFPLPPNYIVDPNNTPDYTELTNEQKSTAMSTSTVITIISIVANVTLAVIMFYKKHLKNCNIYSRFQTQSNTDDTEAIAPWSSLETRSEIEKVTDLLSIYYSYNAAVSTPKLNDTENLEIPKTIFYWCT